MEIVVRKLFVPWVEGDGDEDEKVSGLRGARGPGDVFADASGIDVGATFQLLNHSAQHASAGAMGR